MTAALLPHLASVDRSIARALDSTYRNTMDHFLTEEWDDALVDAGRLCEAALRYLQWRMNGTFTPIDGKSKPNRKNVVNDAKKAAGLPPSLRAQLPQAIELIMDFRNNRNSAHLGDIDPNKMDAACVVQNATWLVGEIARIESQAPVSEVQQTLDQLAERHIPLVQTVGEDEVVLIPGVRAAEQVLVLLYRKAEAVPMPTLRKWTEYTHSTKFRTLVLKPLEARKFIHVDKKTGAVTLLRPGREEAQRIILRHAA